MALTKKLLNPLFQLMEVTMIALLPGFAELPAIQISSVTEENPVGNAPPRSKRVAVYIEQVGFHK